MYSFLGFGVKPTVGQGDHKPIVFKGFHILVYEKIDVDVCYFWFTVLSLEEKMMTLNVIIFSVFTILEGTVLAMEEPPSSSSTHTQRLSQAISDLIYDEPAEKRAYTYVSEYKRLPVYNFGLGKRWADTNDGKRGRPFSFGLGKRIKPYSFGLGKRNDNQFEYQPLRRSLDYLPVEAYDRYLTRDNDDDQLLDYIQEKRGNRLYSFGLGKRNWDISPADDSMPIGKRPNDVTGQRYMFGLGKRMIEEEDTWIVDFEWQNEKNWDYIPKIDGHVIFPLETRHAVGLSKSVDLKLSKIDLPREGSLVLFRNGKLKFSESKNSKTKISRWLKEGKFFWVDPDNWNGVSEAAPHMERIPCRQDDVVLPGTDQTFNIYLPAKDVQVESIRLSNHKYPSTWWDWEEMQKKKEFLGGFLSVKYSQYGCEKCLCQDGSQYDYLKEICAIQKPKCGFAACEYPLKIEGHCCLYCGGRVTIPKGASLAMIRSLVDEVLEQRATRLAWYVRRTWTNNIEVLLKEKTEYTGVDTLVALKDLQTKLHDENIKILYTENPGAPLKDSRLATMLGPFFGAPIIILVLLIASFWYFDYSMRYVLSEISQAWSSVKEKSNKPFSFARFENVLEGNVRIDNPQTRRDEHEMNEELIMEEEVLDEEGTSGGGNFENPLYRSKRDKNFKIEEQELINVDLPLSLTSLKKRAKDNTEDDDDDIEMDIEQ
uniref:Protein amnionless n=1 Tax=Vespula pensylvanica TaxID=30213 RepID=A0A834P5F6_VESPE|nr:hypothetical protein H0235_005679 [Vespula pensylvanica]